MSDWPGNDIKNWPTLGLIRLSFCAGEAQHRRLAGCAVNPVVRGVMGPFRQMRLQSREAVKGASGDRTALSRIRRRSALPFVRGGR